MFEKGTYVTSLESHGYLLSENELGSMFSINAYEINTFITTKRHHSEISVYNYNNYHEIEVIYVYAKYTGKLYAVTWLVSWLVL